MVLLSGQNVRLENRLTGLHVAVVASKPSVPKQFLLDHFRLLRMEGCRVSLICSEGPEARYSAKLTGAEFIPVFIEQTMAPIKDLVSTWHLWRVFRRIRPDMVIAHMSKSGLLGMLAAWLTGVKTRIYYNHGMALFSSTGIRRAILRVVEMLTCRLATHVLFCAQSTCKLALQAGMTRPDNSWVLGNGTISGIDTEKFRPCPDDSLRAAQRDKWGIQGDPVVVGFVGRYVAHKGIRTLIEAWRLLQEETRKRARLVLLGGHVHSEPDIRQLIEQAVADRIHVINGGWTEDMPKAYWAMDVVVLPSWHEGFPYSLLEAQATGLATIASRVPGNIDAIVDGENGLTVPVEDPAALAAAIQQLIENAELRHALGRKARERVISLFRREQVLANMIHFLTQVSRHDQRSRQLPEWQ